MNSISQTQGKRIKLKSFRTRMAIAVPGSLVAVLALVALASAPAQASTTQQSASRGSTKGTAIVVHIPARPFVNKCNGDVANLHGDEYVAVTSTPDANGGGYTVQSYMVAPNMTGQRIAPLPKYGYRAVDVHDTYAYHASAAYLPYTTRVAHWVLLQPQQRDAPTMYLVTVLEETILADGTPIVMLNSIYVSCSEPSCRES